MRKKQIPTATPPPISMTGIPMELPVNQQNTTGSGKSKTKLQIRMVCEQDSNEIPMAVPMFSKSSYLTIIVAMFYDRTGRNRKIQDGGHRTSNTYISVWKKQVYVYSLYVYKLLSYLV